MAPSCHLIINQLCVLQPYWPTVFTIHPSRYTSAQCSPFMDPLVNCLQLQRLLRSIKHVQGTSPPKRLPITIDLLKVIQRSLDLNSQDHIILWEACCLCLFGFLCTGEFTTHSPFDSSIHLTVSDVQENAFVQPTCFRVHIKCSKTDPFCMGCNVYVGRAIALSTQWWPLVTSWHSLLLHLGLYFAM